jgi:hypothetical protein
MLVQANWNMQHSVVLGGVFWLFMIQENPTGCIGMKLKIRE